MVALVLAGGAVCGCSGDASLGANTSASADGGASSATFTDVYDGLIVPHCTSCHAGGGAAGNLDMGTATAAYANLVGIMASGPACGGTGQTRVVAGNAARSLLYTKVDGTQSCGMPMPYGLTPLEANLVIQLKSWIDSGARGPA